MIQVLPPLQQILVCVNERECGSCCKKVNGEEIAFALKQRVSTNTRVTRTKCLGHCNAVGASIVIQPQNVWITEVTMDDVDEIVKRYNT